MIGRASVLVCTASATVGVLGEGTGVVVRSDRTDPGGEGSEVALLAEKSSRGSANASAWGISPAYSREILRARRHNSLSLSLNKPP